MSDRQLILWGRAAGGILLVGGTALLALAVWMVERQLTIRGHIEKGAAIFVIVSGLISLFCLTAGWRLAANRPNKYQSALPPWGWLIIAVVFAAFAAAMLVLGPQSRELTMAALLSALFSFAAITAASAAHVRRKQSSAL